MFCSTLSIAFVSKLLISFMISTIFSRVSTACSKYANVCSSMINHHKNFHYSVIEISTDSQLLYDTQEEKLFLFLILHFLFLILHFLFLGFCF